MEDSFWTFLPVEGVEPTNNHIERTLRLPVPWRNKPLGSQSEARRRSVERQLTVLQTRRMQGRPVLAYLYAALVPHGAGLPGRKVIYRGWAVTTAIQSPKRCPFLSA